MSIRRRRTAASSREQMLATARALLVAHGPAALTLSRVAVEMGTGHPNVLHHFGSAAGLRAALLEQAISEAGEAVEEAVSRIRSGGAPIDEIVNALFDAFALKGIGRLLAWAMLHGEADSLRFLEQELVCRLGRVESGARKERAPHLAATAQLLIAAAFSDSLIGPLLSRALGRSQDEIRHDLGRLIWQMKGTS